MIYVDQLVHYPACSLTYKRWCHMATDGDIAELHAFAKQLGLRRIWFQDKPGHPHYDLVPSKRILALKYGAKSVTAKELIAICYPEWARKFEQAFGPILETMLEEKLQPLQFEDQEV